jgi:hypothetical protein
MKIHSVIAAVLECVSIVLLVSAYPSGAVACIAIGVTILGMLPPSDSIATRFIVGAFRLIGVSALVFAVAVLGDFLLGVIGGMLYAASVLIVDIFEGVE